MSDTRNEPTALLDAALSYAARGWPVHPLAPRTKAATVDDWPIDASTDFAVVRAWWKASPDANIGVVTGRRSGLLVLDIDGPEGRASLEGLEVPETLTQDTGRVNGGQHLLYGYEGPTRNRQGVRPGLDVKGDGGYIVAAPSMHPSGTVYRLHEGPLAPPPEWLVQEASPRPQGPGNRPRRDTVTWPPGVLALLTDPFDLENDVAVRHADRDTYRDRSKVIAQVACTMVRLGETDEGIFRRLSKSTLKARKDRLHDPDGWLRQDIARARQKVESEPEGHQDLDEHVLLARWHVASATTQKVLRAHQVLCQQQGLGQYVASVRDIALGASCSIGSAATHTNRLVQQGWLRLIYKAAKGRGTASIYRLSLPRSVQGVNTSTPTNPVDGGVHELHTGTDLDPSQDGARYQALGPRFRTATLLDSTRPTTVPHLAAVMGKSEATIRRHLRTLMEQKIALRVETGFVLAPTHQAALEHLAHEKGVAGKRASMSAAVDLERLRRTAERTRHARATDSEMTSPLEDNYTVVDVGTGEVLYSVGERASLDSITGAPSGTGHIGRITLTVSGRHRLDRVLEGGRLVDVVRKPNRRRKTATPDNNDTPPEV